MFDDLATGALKSALSGLALRQRAIADNIANIETPGFRARQVDFEAALRSAVEAGTPERARPAVSQSTEPTRLNGNNVNLDDQTLSSLDTDLRYQWAVRALDGKYDGLRTVISGSGS